MYMYMYNYGALSINQGMCTALRLVLNYENSMTCSSYAYF